MAARAVYDDIAEWYERSFLGDRDTDADTLGIDRAVRELLGAGTGVCLELGCGTGVHADRGAVASRTAATRRPW
ncbi:MAG TPA: hypothetical protein VGN37_09900 [Actinocatenispora sp.]